MEEEQLLNLEDWEKSKQEILKKIAKEASYRPLVPFLGAGVSVSAGFPTVRFVIHYLAKVYFAIQFGVFEERFPIIKEHQQSATDLYRRHPSKYLEDFGWPNYGQLNADIWDWLDKKDGRGKIYEKCRDEWTTYKEKYEEIKTKKANGNHSEKYPPIPDMLANDICIGKNIFSLNEKGKLTSDKHLELRDHQLAIVQWVLRKELAAREEGTSKPLLYRWLKWKKYYSEGVKKDEEEPELLYGDWEILLDMLCEGNFNLIDELFTSFEQGLSPTISHQFLAFLKPKLGMPLILTTNFDTLLEQALQNEGILPKVFDIHRDAELPAAHLVHKQFSVIKLHGSSYGLRLGERLKYQLESEARDNALKYIPEDALILVIGFNGSERRIMQMLQAIVGEGRFNNEQPRLIWIQGPSKPGPLFDELTKNSNGSVLGCKVGHADTFLEELFFYITKNSYQSSVKFYSTVPNRPLMMQLKNFPSFSMEEKDKLRRPVHLCFGNLQEDRSPSSNWSSLAAMAFTNTLGLGYTIIWINLESHHTVEGVIAEFFERVRELDPQAPSCVITNLGTDDDLRKNLEKTVERISDVFKRGRYILVLDAVESFGRAQTVHHGMVSKNHERPQDENHEKAEIENDKKIKQIENLSSFLETLLRLKTPLLPDSDDPDNKRFFAHEYDPDRSFWDSYVVVAADKPRLRHQTMPNNSEEKDGASVYEKIKILVTELSEYTTKLGDDDKYINYRNQDKAGSYDDIIEEKENGSFKTQVAKLVDTVFNNSVHLNERRNSFNAISQVLQAHSKNIIDEQHLDNPEELKRLLYDSIKFSYQKINPFNDFLKEAQANSIELDNNNPLKTYKKNITICPELNLFEELSDHWNFKRKKQDNNQEYAQDRAKSVLSLLKILRQESKKYDKSSIEAFVCMLSIFRRPRSLPLIHSFIDRWALRGLDNEKTEKAHQIVTDLLQQISINDENNQISAVSQNHEGGTVWLYREAFETTYDALTEYLRRNDWQDWGKQKVNSASAVIDGLLSIAWHLYAARAYYVDIFLPSHDIRAFYEYLYHRVSAVRTITLLITIIEMNYKERRENSFDSELNSYLGKILGTDNESDGLISKYISNINAIDSFDESSDLKSSLIKLRKRAVETLLTALNKNGSLFRSVATPDTVIAWSYQFIESEIEQMRKIKVGTETIAESDEIKFTMTGLEKFFIKLRFKAWLSKMDYDSILKEIIKKSKAEKKEPKYNNILIAEFNPKNYQLFISYFHSISKEFSEKLDEINSISNIDEEEFENLLLFSRCFVELRLKFTSPANKHTYNYNKLFSVINKTLRKIERKLKDNSIDKNKIYWLNNRLQFALELKCKLQFSNWYFWQPLLTRENSSDRSRNAKLLKAEKYSTEYENLLRVTTKTNDEDAKRRSAALTIRARSLYLRGHFQQAHHYLDLATTGFLIERRDHKIHIGIVHIIRAELLAISAHEHYLSLSGSDQVIKILQKEYLPFHLIKPEDIKLYQLSENIKFQKNRDKLIDPPKSKENRKSFPKEIGELSKLLLPVVNSSLKKIERAEQELHQAEILLCDLSHQNEWLIYLEFGWAQIKIERMLYEIEKLFLNWQTLSVTEYLQKNGYLEQTILSTLHHIRNALDAIPYQSKTWGKIKEDDGLDSPDNGPLMIRIECGVYTLWRQLFVVGAYYSSLLSCLYINDGSIQLNKNTAIFEIAKHTIKTCITGTALTAIKVGNYQQQWKSWCKAMRFGSFSDDENMKTFELVSANADYTLKLNSVSLRAAVIDSMKIESDNEKIEMMWDIRRNKLKRDNKAKTSS